jgi:hypothetical protein
VADRYFNPDRVAYFEAHGWRAYYDRDWRKLEVELRQCYRSIHARLEARPETPVAPTSRM